jgi:hypothetical protein
VEIWYIFPRFGILCEEKSGNPGFRYGPNCTPVSIYSAATYTVAENGLRGWRILCRMVRLPDVVVVHVVGDQLRQRHRVDVDPGASPIRLEWVAFNFQGSIFRTFFPRNF